MLTARRTFFTFILSALFLLVLIPGTGLGVGKDFNGDGRDEIASLYDYPNYCAAIWIAKPAVSGFSQKAAWASSYGGWDATKSRVFAGPFDTNATYDDIAILQSYPNASAALWIYSSNGTGFSRSAVWSSALWGFDVSKTKTASGDFDGDGREEILALAEFPNACAALILFDNPGTGWTVRPVWASPNGSFDVTTAQVSAGDFDNDGKDELAVLKAYPNSCAAVWVFNEGAPIYSATAWWASSMGAWDAGKSRMVAGDYENDGDDDLAVMYEYPNKCAAIWQFTSNGSLFAASPKWASGYGGWDAALSKLMAADVDGNGSDELYIMQEYPNNCAALWQYTYAGASYSRGAVWASSYGAWNVKKSRLADGNTFIPTQYYIGGKAIDINLSTQTLVASESGYAEPQEGVYGFTRLPVFSTLVSSGRSPFNTPTGNFAVYAKDVVGDMSGFGGTAEYYYVSNVPYILWFLGGYSIHGAYWHNDFGNVRSHGCVNVPVDAGAWLYNWAPVGTPVNVHY